MANTTFSGPIRAGTISNTTGTTLGDNVANVGQVVMCQSQAITQADGTTNIVIPANSQIVAIEEVSPKVLTSVLPIKYVAVPVFPTETVAEVPELLTTAHLSITVSSCEFFGITPTL